MTPYIGLRYFTEQDAELFYGRDEHVAELLGKLAGNRFVAVLGSSGSGKSSLVRAGLLPELRAGMIPAAGPQWKVVEFKPGRAPLAALGEALRTALGVAEAQALVEEGPLGIARVVQAAALPERTNVLILADQFEEVFRFQQEDSARALEEGQKLVRRLLDAAAQTEVAVYVLMVMRSDYLGECAQFPELPERMSESLYLVPRLRRDQLEEAITAPVGGRIEPAVVQRLLAEVGSDPDQLPRLQHLLLRMWLAGGEPLTMARYESRGGWVGGLEQHLEEAFARVPAATCQRVFRALSELDKGRAVRRRASLGELIEVCGPEAAGVVERFRAEGFLAPQADPVDITHESVLREWRRVQGWLEAEQWDAKCLRELSEAAIAAGWPDPAKALSGWTLENLLEWRNSAQPNAAWARRYGLAVEDGFLDWSEAEEQRVQKEREALEGRARAADAERLEAERREALERGRRSRRTAIVLGLVALGFAGLWVWAWEQRRLADQQWARAEQALKSQFASEKAREETQRKNKALADEAQTKSNLALAGQLVNFSRLVFDGEPLGLERSVLQAASSLQVSRSLEADIALRRSLDLLAKPRFLWMHRASVSKVAISSDGRTLATGSKELIRVFDLKTGREIWSRRHDDEVTSVSFSPNGKWVATGSRDGTACVREAATGNNVVIFDHEAAVYGVTFSPNGRRLATASLADVRVFDVPSKEPRWHRPSYGAMVVAFSPDGALIGSGTAYGVVQVWDANMGDLRSRSKHEMFNSQVTAVAFNADGSKIASATDFSLTVLDSKKGTPLWHQVGPGLAVTFCGQTSILASGGMDGAHVFRLSGQEIARLDQGQVDAVACSPNGHRIATGGQDRTARVFDFGSGKEMARLAHLKEVAAVAFSPDGRWVATGSEDGAARVFPAIHGDGVDYAVDPAPLKGFTQLIGSDALVELADFSQTRAWFSRDGRRVVTAGADASVRVFDLRTGSERRLPTNFDGEFDAIKVALTAADGRYFARADRKGVQIYDAANLSIQPLAHQGHVSAVALGQANRLLLIGLKGVARLTSGDTSWDIRLDGKGAVEHAAISPNDGRLAFAVHDKIRVFDVRSRQEIAQVRCEECSGLSFSADGERLAFAGKDFVGTYDAAGDRKWPQVGSVDPLALSNDGNTLAAAGASGVRIIDTQDGQEKGRIQLSNVKALRFTPDGRYLEAASQATVGWAFRRQVQLEDLSVPNDIIITRHPLRAEDLIKEACAKVTRNLTLAEWHQYAGKEVPYQRACANLPYPPDHRGSSR